MRGDEEFNIILPQFPCILLRYKGQSRTLDMETVLLLLV